MLPYSPAARVTIHPMRSPAPSRGPDPPAGLAKPWHRHCPGKFGTRSAGPGLGFTANTSEKHPTRHARG
jgi:hypothetical protein